MRRTSGDLDFARRGPRWPAPSRVGRWNRPAVWLRRENYKDVPRYRIFVLEWPIGWG